jgi:hypothetical protein
MDKKKVSSKQGKRKKGFKSKFSAYQERRSIMNKRPKSYKNLDDSEDSLNYRSN